MGRYSPTRPGRATRRVAPAALLALLALSGCGGSADNGVASKSGPEILAATKGAALEAKSVHVVSSSAQGPASFKSDLYLSRDGGRGNVSLLGLRYEAIRREGSVYIKGDSRFYKRLELILGFPIRQQPGMWLKSPATNSPLAQLAAVLDLRGELDRLLSTPGSLTTGAAAKVEDQRAVTVQERTKLYTGVLYVAATGTPYPIALIKTKGKAKNELEGGRTTFSEWDRPVSLIAPSPWMDVETLRSEAHR
jgi:hypothetical protein